jgi:hypothetical protein
MKKFVSIATMIALWIAVAIPVATTTACTSSQIQLAETIANATASILVNSTGAYWAPTVQAALNQLQAAIGTGDASAVQIAVAAVETAVAFIPITAPYAPEIDIIVAAIEAFFGTHSTQVSGIAKAQSVGQLYPANPHLGRVVISKKFLESDRDAFIRYWNAANQANHHGLIALK